MGPGAGAGNLPNIIPDLTASVGHVQTMGLEAIGVVFPTIMTIAGAIVVWRLALSVFRRAAA